jgi:hypothetical protein
MDITWKTAILALIGPRRHCDGRDETQCCEQGWRSQHGSISLLNRAAYRQLRVPMLALYRLARDFGHTIISSLTFALFNRPLPYDSPEIEQEIDRRLAQIAELDRERGRPGRQPRPPRPPLN